MEDVVESARPALEWETPLALPLNFQLPDQEIAREGEQLLANGSYTAIRLVKYAEKTTCDGCGRPRQAKQCVVIRDDETREEKHIGMNCLGRLYKEQADAIRAHASTVRQARDSLLNRLRLRDVASTEEAVRRVRELALAYLPYSAEHVRSLDAIDTLTPNKQDQDLLVKIRYLALYHQEWQDNQERARRRWSALKTHPMLFYLHKGERAKVQELCARALASGTQLPESEVHALNVWLRKAGTWSPPFRQLVRPEDYLTAEAYEAALRTALKARVDAQEHDRVYWRSPFTNHPTEIVSTKCGESSAVVALDRAHAGRFRTAIMNEDSYRSGTRSVIVEEGQSGTFTETTRYRQRGGFDREDEDDSDSDVTRAGRAYPYVSLGWALVEHYTPTHRAWLDRGRDHLEWYL